MYDFLLKAVGYCDFHRGIVNLPSDNFEDLRCPACNNITIKKVLFEKTNNYIDDNVCKLIEIKFN